MDVQLLLLTVQEHFQKELISNLEIFRKDCAAFVVEYNTNGPMQASLTDGRQLNILTQVLHMRCSYI